VTKFLQSLRDELVRRDYAAPTIRSYIQIVEAYGTAADLQKLWIGHSTLRTGDRYSHTDEELEFRREAVEKVGVTSLVGPTGPTSDPPKPRLRLVVNNAA
jgi:hypothetical protein